MQQYNPSEIEKKWQDIWEKSEINKAGQDPNKKKYYCLDMFPYPSGSGLHVGHWRGYVLSDVAARVKKIEGFNVLHPMGWDAFGSPAENDAIKKGIHPKVSTENNIASIRPQLKKIGACYDWDREVNTTDPYYYKWTQWTFIQMFKKGLAYKKEMPINWCPSCKTGISNEDVVNGQCERCGTEVTKKNLNQWMIRITAYADRLLKDLNELNEWPEKVRKMQADWIGRSEGSLVKFKVNVSRDGKCEDLEESLRDNYSIDVFTTRADTLYGCTYIVMAPECNYTAELRSYVSNLKEVDNYIVETKKKSNIDRMSGDDKEKTGVKLEGITAINPINGREVDVFITDYVIADYGTGAVMAVPAHDERDYAFAKKYNLEIIESIRPLIKNQKGPDAVREDVSFTHRNAILAIIKDPENGKFLCLKWKKIDWSGFVIGGIEEGEDLISAAKREIQEETGYKNLKFIRTIGDPVDSQFYHVLKNENRWAHFQGVYFELENNEHEEISDKEKEIHDVLWVDQKDVERFINAEDMKLIWQRFESGSDCYPGYGILVNSGEFTELSSEEGKKKITEKLENDGLGGFVTNYKIRDWVFARQRYWGEPIPIVNCEKCGLVPMDEKDLPLLLPEIEKYEPTGTGESPLAAVTDWVNTTCPQCGGPAKRETDTMPQWAGSCWYFLRYADPKNKEQMFSPESLKYWLPVDLYVGGVEHAVLHLLYSRFWVKFLYDIGVVDFKEPFTHLFNQGMVYKLGAKMSKSKGNVVSPDDIIEKYGTDALRAYELFVAPPDQDAEWSDSGVPGVYRFLKKYWDIGQEVLAEKESISTEDILSESFEIGETELEVATHKLIKKFNEALGSFRYNTLVSTLMEFTNYISTKKDLLKKYPQPYLVLTLLLSPLCPHVAEEVWKEFGFEESIFSGRYFWPKHDENKIREENITIIVQENGKLKANILIPADSEETTVLDICKKDEKISQVMDGAKKVVYVKNRLINFVK